MMFISFTVDQKYPFWKNGFQTWCYLRFCFKLFCLIVASWKFPENVSALQSIMNFFCCGASSSQNKTNVEGINLKFKTTFKKCQFLLLYINYKRNLKQYIWLSINIYQDMVDNTILLNRNWYIPPKNKITMFNFLNFNLRWLNCYLCW